MALTPSSGPIRAIVEAPDNLKDWGATVIDIFYNDSERAVTVTGDSRTHLSAEDLVDALSLGLSESAKIEGKIGLVRRMIRPACWTGGALK